MVPTMPILTCGVIAMLFLCSFSHVEATLVKEARMKTTWEEAKKEIEEKVTKTDTRVKKLKVEFKTIKGTDWNGAVLTDPPVEVSLSTVESRIQKCGSSSKRCVIAEIEKQLTATAKTLDDLDGEMKAYYDADVQERKSKKTCEDKWQ